MYHFIREQGWGSGESARLPPMCPRFGSQIRRHMWVEFVVTVGSLPCSERFFSRYSGFPLSSKTNFSKFQFDLDYCQALYHEPLAQVIMQALPVFDIKFAFTFLLHCLVTRRYQGLRSGEVCLQANWPTRPKLIPVSVA